MDIGTIISLSISGAAIAFSVFTFCVERHHKKKYDERLAKLEIDEKEKSLEEEKKAFIRCTPLKREAGKNPHFLVKNIGKHAALDLTFGDGFLFRPEDETMFPFPRLDPGQTIDVYCKVLGGQSSVTVQFAYVDGLGRRYQEVSLQV